MSVFIAVATSLITINFSLSLHTNQQRIFTFDETFIESLFCLDFLMAPILQLLEVASIDSSFAPWELSLPDLPALTLLSTT